MKQIALTFYHQIVGIILYLELLTMYLSHDVYHVCVVYFDYRLNVGRWRRDR